MYSGMLASGTGCLHELADAVGDSAEAWLEKPYRGSITPSHLEQQCSMLVLKIHHMNVEGGAIYPNLAHGRQCITRTTLLVQVDQRDLPGSLRVLGDCL